MPASKEFIEKLLDVVDKHVSAFSGGDEAKLALAKDICGIAPGNQSVWITQQRLQDAAEERWSK